MPCLSSGYRTTRTWSHLRALVASEPAARTADVAVCWLTPLLLIGSTLVADYAAQALPAPGALTPANIGCTLHAAASRQ